MQQIPWLAAHEKLLTAFAGDATPDVCQLGNTWIPEFGRWGRSNRSTRTSSAQVPLIREIIFRGCGRPMRSTHTFSGSPGMRTRGCCFIERTCWRRPGGRAAADVDRVADRHARCKAQVNPAGYAILMPTNEWEHLTILGCRRGSQMLRENGKFGNFNSPEFRQAFEFYVQLFDEGLAPPVSNTQIANYWEEFGRGYFAMYITGPWNIGEFRRRLPENIQNEMGDGSLASARQREIWQFAGWRKRIGNLQTLGTQRGGLATDRVSLAAGTIGAVLSADRESSAARVGLEIRPACR